MNAIWVIFKREFGAYFLTPLAYVFIVIFLSLSGAFTFYIGNFFGRGTADLGAFFTFHPWLYLFLIPAVAMRLWAEERKSGTIELLMTLPITPFAAVAGKFLAAWVFIGIALLLTTPIWITVNYLGSPDNGVAFAGYLASFLMAGAYLAIGACISALSKNQVIAFVIAAAVCFLFMMSGLEMVQALFSGWAPQWTVDVVAGLSFLTHFNAIIKGVVDLRDVIFFASLIGVCLAVNVFIIELKKGS